MKSIVNIFKQALFHKQLLLYFIYLSNVNTLFQINIVYKIKTKTVSEGTVFHVCHLQFLQIFQCRENVAWQICKVV